MTRRYTVWGRYPSQGSAEAGKDRGGWEDGEHGPFYRLRYSPSEKWPTFPWALLAFERREDANACTEQGEVVER